MRGPSMLLALGLVFGLACGSASPLSGEGTSDAMAECPIGEETCPCSSSGACIPGLSCESNVCVAPGGTGSTSGTGGTDTTGDGSSTAPADASSSSGEPAASSSSDDGANSSSSDGAAESSSSSSSDGAGESSSGSGSSSTT
jgi:hypothetical protein